MGFIQGMSYIAVILRMNMSTYHTFKAFCSLLYVSDILFANFTFNTAKVSAAHQINGYYTVFNHLVKRNFPEKFEVMKAHDIHPSIFMVEWFYTLFARQFNFESLFRLWDVLFLQGEIVLFRLVLLVFSKTDFSTGHAGDILGRMKRLDKVLEADFYLRLDESLLHEDDYLSLLHLSSRSGEANNNSSRFLA